jgi:predicted NBD/HSP70 family sugar kinase
LVPRGRRAVRGAVLTSLRIAPGTSKIGLARGLGLSPSTVSLAVRELQHDDLVVVTGQGDSTGGRPPEGLRLNPVGPLMLGVDLSGSAARLAVLNLAGEIVFGVSVPFERQQGHVALDPILETSVEVARRWPRISGVGVAVPGLIARERGVVRFAANLGWTNVALRDLMVAAVGLPTWIDRNTNAALLGEEWWGLRPVADPLVFVTVGSGIGAAIKIGGRFLDGASGIAGELGHLQLFDGPRCRCGKDGCLEARASAQALVDRANVTSLALVAERLRADDHDMARLVADVGASLGAGLAALVDLLDPQLVVIGGEILELEPWVVPSVREAVRRSTFSEESPAVSVVPSALGDLAPLMGAGTLGFERLFAGDSALMAVS